MSPFVVDTVAPTTTSVSIVSNNTVSTAAKESDVIILSFNTNENIGTPTVSIAGNSAIVSGGPQNWTATHTVLAGDTNGVVTFTINAIDTAGNSMVEVTDVSDTSSVSIDTVAPIISDINPSITFPPGANITWTTDEASTTYVEYGLTNSYGSSTATNPSLVTNHTATISGLNQVTTYHFRVISVDSVGNIAMSADRVFTTSGATGGSVPSDAGVGSPAVVSNTELTPNPTPTPTPNPTPEPQTPQAPIPETPTENPTPENNPIPTPETPANPETNPEETPTPTPAPTPTPTPTPTPATGGGTTGGTGGNPAPFNPADATLDIGGGTEPDVTATVEEGFDPADATLDEGG